MSAPINVTVVRPRPQASAFAVKVVVGAGMLALAAWIAMLLLPSVLHGVHWGYWRCIAAILLVRTVLPNDSSYLTWTAEAAKKRAGGAR